MRLRRLDLTRYGKFTDRHIDFGERIDGEPDLHIVYGPNEAGKSTAFSAFLDLLFGIEAKSRYGFLHPYDTMRIGACLELGVGPRDLVRIKRPAPTLRNAADEPLPEAIIQGDLSGLDRTAYRTMFSLDDESLEAGGNAILASRGELGQLLFSASAGLSELSRMLLDLKAEADGFAKLAGRSGELADLKAELPRLKQAREAIDTLASAYNRMAAERDTAEASYQAALAEQATAQAALARVRRVLAAGPLMAILARLRTRIEAFADLPAPPPEWLSELPELQRQESTHRTEHELATAEVKRLSEALAAIEVDQAALALAPRLERLAALRARHFTAELDLPARLREHAGAGGEVAAILARLGCAAESDPARLLLTAAQASALNTLIAGRSGVLTQVNAAATELARAVFELGEAKRALHEAGDVSPAASLAPLHAAMAAMRESDHAHRLRSAARARSQHEGDLANALRALAPWQGSAAELAVAQPPDLAIVEAWDAAARKIEARLEQQRLDVERDETALVRASAELDAIAATAGLLSDQQAGEIRAAREAAWSTHRRALDADTADRFEAALRRDDAAAAARQGHERDLAKLHQAAQAAAIQQAGATRARALLAEAEAERHRQAEMLAAAANGLELAPSGVPSAAWLLGWIARRDRALEIWSLCQQAERDQAGARADGGALSARLAAALGQAGLAPPAGAGPDSLAEAAQRAIDQDTRAEALRLAVSQAEREIRKREQALQGAATAEKAWLAAWGEACAACWLGKDGAGLPIEIVREMLLAITDLAGALKTQAGLAGRIRDMQADQSAFAQEVDGLAGALGVDGGGVATIVLADQAVARVQQAARAAEEAQKCQAALAAAEDRLRVAEGASRRHAQRAGPMMAFMQAPSLIELSAKLRDAAEKAGLLVQAAHAEADILAALRAGTLEEAQALLGAHAESELEGDQARLAAQLENLEARTRMLFAAGKEAADRIAAVGGDDAAARIEAQRRTALLDIEDRAARYLRLRLGIAAAERGLRAYRDKHRSAMMVQASDAFRTISRGAYRALGTQPDREGSGEVLVALGADGGSKLAVDLSKGTRFQLYLALRAAGYREFARLRPPVPFIADDIMETFDDFRAEETLRVLEDMARLGQVIYLTHHDHLREIAARVTPGVRVHRLGHE